MPMNDNVWSYFTENNVVAGIFRQTCHAFSYPFLCGHHIRCFTGVSTKLKTPKYSLATLDVKKVTLVLDEFTMNAILSQNLLPSVNVPVLASKPEMERLNGTVRFTKFRRVTLVRKSNATQRSKRPATENN